MPYIGIDFGTSNSVVANFQFGHAEVVPNREGHKWTPSVATLRRDGSLAFGPDAQEDQTVLVYDFGGGTLDVTVLRIHHGIFEEISSKGIGKLGGDDLDTALGALIGKRFQEKTGYDILNSPYKQQFMLAVERAKI